LFRVLGSSPMGLALRWAWSLLKILSFSLSPCPSPHLKKYFKFKFEPW